MNKNYLNIYNKKEHKGFLFKTILFKALQNIKLTKKQKFWGVISLFCLGVASVMKAQNVGSLIGLNIKSTPIISIQKLFEQNFENASEVYIKMLSSNWSGLNVIKVFLEYISDIQLASIKVVNDLPFGERGMFDHIVNGITIFAVIGCIYKLYVHFVNTERFDNVKAFGGFFQFLFIGLLFIFSDQIVDRVVSLNQPIDAAKMKAMASALSNELDKALITDLKGTMDKITELETKKQNLEDLKKEGKDSWLGLSETIDKLKIDLEIWKLLTIDANFMLVFKYVYYTIFIMLISSIMAIPAFILTIMVKVLLTVMVAGTKLVFLLAFIPGFENTWKTFMLNMLNILLWVPIFNALYAFIVTLIIGLMTDNTLGSGQIVWLTIVSIILAFQSLSLTTSAAGVVINGAGAGMAGAMGSLATMSGVGVGMSVAKTAVGAAATVAGAAVGGSIGASAASKFMKK